MGRVWISDVRSRRTVAPGDCAVGRSHSGADRHGHRYGALVHRFLRSRVDGNTLLCLMLWCCFEIVRKTSESTMTVRRRDSHQRFPYGANRSDNVATLCLTAAMALVVEGGCCCRSLFAPHHWNHGRLPRSQIRLWRRYRATMIRPVDQIPGLSEHVLTEGRANDDATS